MNKILISILKVMTLVFFSMFLTYGIRNNMADKTTQYFIAGIFLLGAYYAGVSVASKLKK